jgi:hypothetical protein
VWTGRRKKTDAGSVVQVLVVDVRRYGMRSEAEVREQYEFLESELASEEMRHEGVRKLFTHYRRALGWVLEEEEM